VVRTLVVRPPLVDNSERHGVGVGVLDIVTAERACHVDDLARLNHCGVLAPTRTGTAPIARMKPSCG
jgi:hypothetical protein